MLKGHWAWDVPKSNMVVVLKKVDDGVDIRSRKHKIYYSAGVCIKTLDSTESGYSFFNVRGDEPFCAFENLLAVIDKSVEFVFWMMDKCSSGFDGMVSIDSWKYPRDNAKSMEAFFMSLPRMVTMDGLELKVSRRIRDNGSTSYYTCIMNGDDAVFISSPSSSEIEALENMKTTVIGAGAMLEKFQGMAWEVMIDNSSPDYGIRANGGTFKLNKVMECAR